MTTTKKTHFVSMTDPDRCSCGVQLKARDCGGGPIMSVAERDAIRACAETGMSFGEIEAYMGQPIGTARFALHTQ